MRRGKYRNKRQKKRSQACVWTPAVRSFCWCEILLIATHFQWGGACSDSVLVGVQNVIMSHPPQSLLLFSKYRLLQQRALMLWWESYSLLSRGVFKSKALLFNLQDTTPTSKAAFVFVTTYVHCDLTGCARRTSVQETLILCSRMWDHSFMQARCWLCSSSFPPREKLTAFHTVITGVRDHGCALPFQRATFQLSLLARLTPVRAPAALPQLIDKLPWWVETPCHQLLSQWKSIKNNTHLYPWAQSPFVFPVYQWLVLFNQNVFKQQREKVSWWVGW